MMLEIFANLNDSVPELGKLLLCEREHAAQGRLLGGQRRGEGGRGAPLIKTRLCVQHQ